MRARILCLALMLLASPAWADNPHPAQWQGARTSGDGVQFFNSGNGVTLQDAGQGNVAFPGGIDLTHGTQFSGVPSAANSWLWMNAGTLTGSCSASGGFPVSCALGEITIADDQINSTNTRFIPVLQVNHTFGGGSANANGWGGIAVQLTQSGLTASNTNNVAGLFKIWANASNGGGVGTESGGYFAINAVAEATSSSATNLVQIIGEEIDVALHTGSSSIDKIALQIISTTNDLVAPSGANIGGTIASQLNGTGENFLCGWCIGNHAGFNGIASTGTLFGGWAHLATAPGTGSLGTVAHGVDISNFTFSSDAFKSPGFLVDGSGNIIDTSTSANRLTVAVSGFTPFDSSSWSNSFVRNGTVFTSTGNQFGVYSETTVQAASGSTSNYEKGALFGSCIQNDISGAHLYDCVGADLRTYISATNTLGRAWGSVQEAIINTGGDGLLTGTEIDIVNNGTDQSAVNTTTSKYGLAIIAEGSADTTAGIFGQTASRKFHNFIYADPGIITSGGFFINFLNDFTVDGSGNVLGATATLTAAAPTVAAARVGLGSTTAAAANCNGGGGTPTACLVINVGGTTRYVPYF